MTLTGFLFQINSTKSMHERYTAHHEQCLHKKLFRTNAFGILKFIPKPKLASQVAVTV